MQWSDIRFDPSSRVLRQFAGFWLVFFGALAAWEAFGKHHQTLAMVLAALAVLVGPLGLVRPQAVRPVYVVAMILAFPIGWVVSRVALAAIFFGIFTPVALVFRITGRDVLNRTWHGDRLSYWQSKPAPADASSYFRQF